MTNEDLLQKIRQANDAYREGNSIMTDVEFDSLVEQLRQLDPDNDWFKKGVQDKVKSRKELLPIPMYSLEKVKSYEDIIRWIESCKLLPSDKIIVTPKYDGISLCVDELADRVWTRGDGEFGQRSDEHFSEMNVVKSKKTCVYTYGEAIFKTTDFLKIKEKSGYKSARNAVAGLFNSNVVSEFLKEVRYVRYGTNLDDLDKQQQLNKLQQDFKKDVTPYIVVSVESLSQKKSSEDLLNTIFDKLVKEVGFKCDGLVLDIDSADLRKKLGRLPNMNPKYAIAYKNPAWAEREETIVREVRWQISKDGRLAPVVVVDPVDLCGATITRCTAYNAKYIQDNDIKVGSRIVICRSGDVIPKHLETISSPTGPTLPSKCPCCGKQLTVDKIDLICSNKECEDRMLSQCVYFFSTLGFEEFRENTIRKIFKHGENTPYKILSLTKEDMSQIEGLGIVLIKTLTRQFEDLKKRGISFAKMLTACNIFEGTMAEKTCQKILDGLKLYTKEDIDSLNLDSEEIASKVEGIGLFTAANFMTGIRDWVKIENLYSMIPITKYGVEEKVIEGQMTVVFTGFRDKKLEDRLIEMGHKIGSSVSKKTTCLIVKQRGSNSTKEQKAESLNIPIFTLDEFSAKFLS